MSAETATAISPGDKLPTLQRELSLRQLVMYAGASWDWHQMHYDAERAAEAQLPKPIVDGQMFGGMFTNQVTEAFGQTAWVSGMSLKFRSMVFAGEIIEITGEVTSVTSDPATGDTEVTVEQELTTDGRVCATATCTAKIRK